MTTNTYAGLELRRFRRLSEVSATHLAREMGVSRQTVHGIEKRQDVPPAQADAYRAAVARLVALREP